MASFLVWIIIIGVIVWSEVKKQKSRQEGTKPNVPRGQVPNYQRPPQNYQQTRQAGRDAMAKKQQELKARLEQRYGKAAVPAGRTAGNGQQSAQVRSGQQRPGMQGNGQQSAQRRAAQQGDILSRAAANVRETENDQLAQKMSVKHAGGPMTRDAHDLVGAVDITETSELMQQVSDLMIMGYQADLTSHRDFIAEGVEMLNRYEIPTGV